jgi:hypothetical protein
MVRLEGKIDALSAKLDGRLDAVMAKIEAGDRESLQLFELQKSEVGHVAESVRLNTTRIASLDVESQKRDRDLEKEVEKVRTELEDQLNRVRDDVADLPTIKKLVYGFVALVLIAVVTGLLALIIVQP